LNRLIPSTITHLSGDTTEEVTIAVLGNSFEATLLGGPYCRFSSTEGDGLVVVRKAAKYISPTEVHCAFPPMRFIVKKMTIEVANDKHHWSTQKLPLVVTARLAFTAVKNPVDTRFAKTSVYELENAVAPLVEGLECAFDNGVVVRAVRSASDMQKIICIEDERLDLKATESEDLRTNTRTYLTKRTLRLGLSRMIESQPGALSFTEEVRFYSRLHPRVGSAHEKVFLHGLNFPYPAYSKIYCLWSKRITEGELLSTTTLRCSVPKHYQRSDSNTLFLKAVSFDRLNFQPTSQSQGLPYYVFSHGKLPVVLKVSPMNLMENQATELTFTGTDFSAISEFVLGNVKCVFRLPANQEYNSDREREWTE
jgi:hypothetical protein